jgi:hypothetical protein
MKIFVEWKHSSILDFGTRWRWAVSFTFRPTSPTEGAALYPLDRRLVESQSQSGSYGINKKLLSLPGIKPVYPARSSSLYRLSLSRPILWMVIRRGGGNEKREDELHTFTLLVIGALLCSSLWPEFGKDISNWRNAVSLPGEEKEVQKYKT